MEYQQIQKIAKDTMEYARRHIKAGMNLVDIRKMCEDMVIKKKIYIISKMVS